MAEDVALSYGDVVLRREDVDLIKSGWLNDQAIAFAFEWISSNVDVDNAVLVPPPVSYLAAMLPAADGAAVLAQALPAGARGQWVLSAVNNNADPTLAMGGSHWSLLAAKHGRCFHFDSLPGYNAAPARQLAQRLLAADGVVSVTELDVPRQPNGDDCGVYAVAFAHAIAHLPASAGPAEAAAACSRAVGPHAPAQEWRQRLLDAIESLRRG